MEICWRDWKWLVIERRAGDGTWIRLDLMASVSLDSDKG